MNESTEELVALIIKIQIPPSKQEEFINWQLRLNSMIAGFSGFASLEFSTPSKNEWVTVQRFKNKVSLQNWQNSKEYITLKDELKNLLFLKENEIRETIEKVNSKEAVTEVFVTQVSPGMEKDFHDWSAKIHRVEATFPGFRGVYVESPKKEQEENWITLLQFDNVDNLERWIASPEREQLLSESNPFVSSLKSHRVYSSYAGWFGSIAKNGHVPPVWKQTMIVLLVLFPIVMLELKYLPFFTASLNPSLATFIGNSISVTLLAWPCVPLAILLLSWWLNPKGDKKTLYTLLGTGLVFLLYLIEIAIFWNF